MRRRISTTRTLLARRAWAGQAPRRVGARAPRTRSARAVEDGLGHPTKVGGVERAVAVHEADDAVGRVGRQQAGPAGGAEAAAGLVHHPGPAGPGDVGRPVVGAVVDHDGGEAGGHGRQQVGQGAGLVEDGDDDVGHGVSVPYGAGDRRSGPGGRSATADDGRRPTTPARASP